MSPLFVRGRPVVKMPHGLAPQWNMPQLSTHLRSCCTTFTESRKKQKKTPFRYDRATIPANPHACSGSPCRLPQTAEMCPLQEEHVLPPVPLIQALPCTSTTLRPGHGSVATVTYPGGSVGGGVSGRKIVHVPKIDLQFQAPLRNFTFFLRNSFLM